MTIKAHLKTELKRRTAQSSKESATPAAPTPTPAPADGSVATGETPAPATAHEDNTNGAASEAIAAAATNEGVVAPSIEQGDVAQAETLPADVSLELLSNGPFER